MYHIFIYESEKDRKKPLNRNMLEVFSSQYDGLHTILYSSYEPIMLKSIKMLRICIKHEKTPYQAGCPLFFIRPNQRSKAKHHNVAISYFTLV